MAQTIHSWPVSPASPPMRPTPGSRASRCVIGAALAIMLAIAAALAAGAIVAAWWVSPVPSFVVFTPILHGLLLGALLRLVVERLHVAPFSARVLLGCLAGGISIVTLLGCQLFTEASGFHQRYAAALRAMNITATANISKWERFDREVLIPVTGRDGIAGYFDLRYPRGSRRRLVFLIEAAIVTALAATLSVAPRGVRATGRGRKRVPRLALYLWALPTTAVGLLFVVPTLLSGGGIRWVQGVLEVYGGIASAFLRYCTPLRGGASAMTLGHVVLGRTTQLLDFTRAHERVHVRQAERWGALFIPAYLLSSAFVFLRGGRAYEDNPFEREAYALDDISDAETD